MDAVMHTYVVSWAKGLMPVVICVYFLSSSFLYTYITTANMFTSGLRVMSLTPVDTTATYAHTHTHNTHTHTTRTHKHRYTE